MKRLLLLILLLNLYLFSASQVNSPVMTGNAAVRKVLADKSITFNVGSPIPYIYDGGSSVKLQVGFPYNALYMNKTFPGDLFVSKGYFPDQIMVRWEVANNSALIDHFEIYRKKLNESDSVWVDNVDAKARKWEDFYTEANEIYKYKVIAVGIPGEKQEGYTHTSGIGFRTPLATVTGRVSFSGGNGVKNVIISASTDDEVPSRSISLSGSSYIEIPQYIDEDFSTGFTFQAYLKFSSNADAGIFQKENNFQLDYTGNKFVFSVGTETVELPFDVPVDKFVHISAVYDGDSARLIIPAKMTNALGQTVDTLLSAKADITGTITANDNSLIIGKADLVYFTGNIDEVRIWKRSLGMDEIRRDYSRYLLGKEEGFFAYLRMNEGFGNRVYDISKTGSVFNENHGDFAAGNVSWSADVPAIEQLGNRGITDEEGNYIIAGIPFLTDGSAYKFTPLLAPHEFDPAYKILFLSEDAIVHNNINFTDISAFNVNGSVVYRNTTLGVKGVKLLIDGEPVYGPDATQEATDEKGNFEIQVPIGYHYISFQKGGHVFDYGARWPYDEAHPDSIIKHNFNQNLTFGVPFKDTTLVTVMGRVIGGTSSNEIPFGFGQSVNNIGEATIMLDHSSINPELTFDNTVEGLGKDTISYTVATEITESGDTTFQNINHFSNRNTLTTEIYTSPETGEFMAKLIPEKFSIVSIDVNRDDGNVVKNFFGNRIIDLSTNPSMKYEHMYDENDEVIDSIPYHLKFNYIYQTPPQISVTNIDDDVLFYGENEISVKNPVTGLQDTLVVADHFKYPVFEMFKNYSPKISVFESYTNFDTEEETLQSIKEAEIEIINDLALQNNLKTYKLTPEMDGVVVDTFRVGIPNITKSESDATSFTKTMQINVTVDGNTFAWDINGELYRGYITGQRPKGNNFYTEGPQVPEIILRDPPGSKSYAYIETGSGYSVSTGYSTNFDNGSGFGSQILLGCEVTFGGGLAGPFIKTDSKNTGEVGLSFSTSVNSSGKYVQSYQFNERVATSSDPDKVGSMADIYIGKSYNYFYGETDNLRIIPYDLAQTNGVISLGAPELKDTQYTLGIVEGFIMNPDNSDTYFKYTQAHVINKLLPELEGRRNNLFLTSKRSDGRNKYVSDIEQPDLRYGIAHCYELEIDGGDTIVTAYYKMSEDDSILSYHFMPEQQAVEDLNNILNDTIYEIDSIRYYNAQIGIWLDAIRLNEAEKAEAITNNTLDQNISFDGGVGSISRSVTQTFSYNKEESRTKNMNFNLKGTVGVAFNSTGFVNTGTLSISHSLGVSVGESFSQTMQYGYVFNDGNIGDYYSVNVYNRPQNGIFDMDELEGTDLDLPNSFDFGILGQGVSFLGGVIALGTTASYNAGGGIPIVAGAATMAIAAGLSYLPYTSFKDTVTDIGDRFIPGNVRVSSFDIASPIFSTLGGQTMCPHQDLEYTFFYRDEQGDSVVLHKPTLQREKPEVSVEPYEVSNVPITDKAFFNLKLSNNSESNDDQWYNVAVLEGSNPHGAAVRIDGLNANRSFFVPANSTVTKLLSLEPTNKSYMDYDSIGIAMYSPCQAEPTDYMRDIIDVVYISAHFQPACTNVEILEPLDNWVVNVNDKDTMTIRLGGYNLEYESFQSFRFEYKPTSGSIWIPVKYFVNDPSLENTDDVPDTILINNQSFVAFDWDMTGLKDREYDIRTVSVCTDGSENESAILTGILDGQRPQVFGTPQPADGILNIDENIGIQFNEPIEGGLLSQFNFDIKGTLNNYLLKHETYLHFNGSTDYASIPEGISLNDKSFTIEFWVRPDIYRNSVIFSQGNNPASSVEIGLGAGYETYLKLGDTEFSASLTVSQEAAWQYMAYVFDYENGDIFIYQNGKIILEKRSVAVDFNNSGKIYIGKSSVTMDDYFAGSLHELKIWSKHLPLGDVNPYVALSGNEVGLYGYWPIDEAFGELAVDKAANRHMNVFSPWETYPGGYAWNFSGNNSLEIFTGYFAVIPEMDYTIEFWFKDDNPSNTVCLFSNQKGDGTEGENLLDKALSIYATPDGKIWVGSKGNVFEAVSNDYFDNSWHHFALVVRRRGNATAFIDGEPQNEKDNSILGGIAGAKMYLGVRKWDNLGGTGEDRYYSGKLDEFRLWNLAKTTTQIRMDMNSKLVGDEIGLMVYIPFEGYYEDNQGVIQQEMSLENFVSDENATNAFPAIDDSYSPDSPNMKDVRPVQPIAYDFVASEDRIIINPKSYLYPQLEKNIVEITVEGVEDKYGNRMASPVTWTAYVHRNQVRWEDGQRIFTKEVYQSFEFVSSIKNTGGQQIGFSIINLPFWLTVSPSSGVINPESTLELTFNINPALNIGEYNEDIVLRTENGFDEKLPLTVRVYKKPPNWHVDPSRFESTMNMIGKVSIDGVLSTDRFDMVAAFKAGTDSIRGVTNVRYVEEFDSYIVFLTIYGNAGDSKNPGESLDFLIWDASAGQILDNVSPFDITIINNGVIGTTIDPIVFESTGYTRHYIVLKQGWNWVSFNKLSPLRHSLSDFFWALEPENKDIIKTHGGSYSQYSGNSGKWSSGIDSIDFKRMYQMSSHKLDTIVFSGTSLIPEEHPIPLVTGWNHIGYIPDLTMDVTNALRNFVPNESDIIKSQSAFSMYDSRTGWIGTLDVMRPGEGYMFKVNGSSANLEYPNNTILKNAWLVEFLSAPSGWDSDLLQYEGNLSVVAKLDVGNLPDLNINNQMVLGAFIHDECHGYVSPLNQIGLGYSPFFLNVSNNEPGQQVEFRLFDGLTGNFYSINEVKPFVQDAVYGTIQEPLVLTLKGLLTGAGEYNNDSHLYCYPNPFNTEVNVEFSGNLNVKSIDVITTSGSLVKRIFNGNAADDINLVNWNGTNGNGTEVTVGIYFIRVVTNNKVETMKISKTE